MSENWRGLTIFAQLDERKYELGKTVSDEELSNVNLEKFEFHGEPDFTS